MLNGSSRVHARPGTPSSSRSARRGRGAVGAEAVAVKLLSQSGLQRRVGVRRLPRLPGDHGRGRWRSPSRTPPVFFGTSLASTLRAQGATRRSTSSASLDLGGACVSSRSTPPSRLLSAGGRRRVRRHRDAYHPGSRTCSTSTPSPPTPPPRPTPSPRPTATVPQEEPHDRSLPAPPPPSLRPRRARLLNRLSTTAISPARDRRSACRCLRVERRARAGPDRAGPVPRRLAARGHRGTSPAGEEMLILSGALSISGHTAAAGEVPRGRAQRPPGPPPRRPIERPRWFFFSGAGGGLGRRARRPTPALSRSPPAPCPGDLRDESARWPRRHGLGPSAGADRPGF